MTSVVSALAFDYLRMRPGSIVPTEAQDAVAIVVFLVVALSVNTLAGLARTRAAEADQRREEADLAAERARVLAQQQAGAFASLETFVRCLLQAVASAGLMGVS
jgi:K+-sensing histidine kinase KdpD